MASSIALFGADYSDAAAVHGALKTLLDLPDYYGGNADALNDCLGELRVCPALWVRKDGPEAVNQALTLISRVFEANGGEVKEL